MTARLFRVILQVGDLDRAAKFYGEVFGEAGERVSGGRHYFKCGDTILACFSPSEDGDHGISPRPNPDNVYFAVDDLEACRDRVSSAGASDVSAIEVRPWGERSFYAIDPFRNPICFVDETTLFTGLPE
jgi:predicted enzyme related to lactoylglutathione lyase